MSRFAERIAIAVASLALTIGTIALLSGFFSSRDKPDVPALARALGEAFHDQGHAHLRAGQLRPPYDSDPPTSGPHVPLPVRQDRRELSVDQVLEALELGDVVVDYGSPRPPRGLVALARSVAPPFSPALAASGQAVILARRPGTVGLIGLAWAHLVRVSGPTDPLLRDFAEYWLGRGAPGER